MSNTERVDKTLFEEEHYLGKPADANDLLVSRRIALLQEYKDFWSGDRLLEIGCGNGNTVLQISSQFKETVGLEYAGVHRKEFELLRETLGVTNSKFETWDIMSAPYLFSANQQVENTELDVPSSAVGDGLADRLISFEVIEHLPSEEGVGNYAKSLKLNGIAAISVPNKWWIFETHGANLPLLPWNRVPFFSWLPRPLHERWSHARIYTRKRITKLLEKHGFEILKVQYITAPMDVVKWKPLQSFLRNWVFRGNSTTNPFKAVSILVICKRIR